MSSIRTSPWRSEESCSVTLSPSANPNTCSAFLVIRAPPAGTVSARPSRLSILR